MGSLAMAPRVKIACIGAGYVGGPTMAMIAHKCPDVQVTVLDINKDRINAWNSDSLPIYEPGLDEVVFGCRGRNLFFSYDVEQCVAEADVVFVSVNTPTKTKGVGAGYAADLAYWEGAARMIAKVSTSPKIIVEKSTVPVKTAEAIEKVLSHSAGGGVAFDVLSNPEFLAEGTAMSDLEKPDRVIIGGRMTPSGLKAVQTLSEVYAQWVPKDRIIATNLWSSELAKLTANAFLAQRISSINSISALCEATGADITEISRCVGTDSRIGPKFLNASVGFGGSCFQKDILNLVYICRSLNLNEVADYWEQVIKMNDKQKRRFVDRVISSMFNTVKGKRIAILGFAFKKDTGDTRESPAIDVCKGLLDDGALLSVYDPKVSEKEIRTQLSLPAGLGWDSTKHPFVQQQASEINTKIECHANVYDACKDAHAACVLTEWDEFKSMDLGKIYASMTKPAFLFDGRNVVDAAKARDMGFQCYGLGKQFVRGAIPPPKGAAGEARSPLESDLVNVAV